MTFEEFVKKWLKNYAEVELAPKTLSRYKDLLYARILPAFGDKRLEKIKPMDILEFYQSLRKDHKYVRLFKDGRRKEGKSGKLSEQTIRHHHRLISAIFQKAIKWNVFTGENPALHVDAPKVEKKKAACYDLDQIKMLLKVLKKEEFKNQAAVMIALTCGMRLGEVAGLEWQDINFEDGIIEIRQSAQYLSDRGVFTKTTKNESSKRKISANKALLDLLKAYQKDQQSKGFLCTDNTRLFVSWKGEPIVPNEISRWFTGFIRENKLPKLTFHGLRHTSATFLISQGMDIQTIAGRLGHSTSVTTQNIYSHFLKSKDQEAADLLDKAFTLDKPKTEKAKRDAK
nr:site-specific integrase [Desulfosporosinus sp.]